MRDIGWSAMVCGIHTCMGARAVPWRNECGRERTESHYGGKEEGCPWLGGSTALSAGTLEEGLVLSPAKATFAKSLWLESGIEHSIQLQRFTNFFPGAPRGSNLAARHRF